MVPFFAATDIKNGVSAKFWTGQERVRPAIRTDFGPLRVFAVPCDWPVNGAKYSSRKAVAG
jgi:hypothetical protein